MKRKIDDDNWLIYRKNYTPKKQTLSIFVKQCYAKTIFPKEKIHLIQ